MAALEELYRSIEAEKYVLAQPDTEATFSMVRGILREGEMHVSVRKREGKKETDDWEKGRERKR